MVTVEFPTGVPLVVLMVNVEVPFPPVTGEGTNEQLAPVGSPAEQVRATLPLKAFTGVIVMVEVALAPGIMAEVLEAAMLKSGVGAA